MPVFFAIKNEYQEMVHACKNQELLARLRKSLPPKGVASSMHGINVHIKIVEEKNKTVQGFNPESFHK